MQKKLSLANFPTKIEKLEKISNESGVLLIGKIVYDVIYLMAYLKRESEPERYTVMRQSFWSVRLSSDAGIIILVLIGLLI